MRKLFRLSRVPFSTYSLSTLPMSRLSTLPLLLVALAFPLQAAEQDKALAEALAKVNATGASIAPISAGSDSLRFTALNVAKEFTDEKLAVLAPLAAQITAVDLARTKVTDKGLAALAAMKNLTEVHLENTQITDAGLDHLKGLSGLVYLNLYGTKVTDAGLTKLSGLSNLKSLYLWQSQVTKDGVAALQKALPAAQVNNGWTAEDDAKPVAAAAASLAAAKPAATPAAAAPTAAPATAKLDPAVAAKAVVFQDVILPIINNKCASCHGEEKSKGKLRLHTFAEVMKGGSEGPSVIAGKPDDSPFLQRVYLPEDDDEHMPPSDEPQLTKEEIALLKWWIQEGASETVTVAAAKKPADIEPLLGAVLAKGLAAAPAAPAVKEEKPKAKPLTEDEKKAVASVTAKMQAIGASLMPLALDTEQLRLSVINANDKFTDAQVAELAPVAPHVLWVDIARSKITDVGLGTLAKMNNLQRLHLENTSITDAGLAQLAGLRSLEYLNLYGTKVTDAGLAKLGDIQSLRKLFVWQTAVTSVGAKALEAKIPGLVVNIGLSEAEIAKLTAPPPSPATPAKTAEVKKAKPQKAAQAKRKQEAKPGAKPAPAKAPASTPPAAKPTVTPTPPAAAAPAKAADKK
jgi:Leucine-rich repeat (LRR) protein